VVSKHTKGTKAAGKPEGSVLVSGTLLAEDQQQCSLLVLSVFTVPKAQNRGRSPRNAGDFLLAPCSSWVSVVIVMLVKVLVLSKGHTCFVCSALNTTAALMLLTFQQTVATKSLAIRLQCIWKRANVELSRLNFAAFADVPDPCQWVDGMKGWELCVCTVHGQRVALPLLRVKGPVLIGQVCSRSVSFGSPVIENAST
jgi:hypothetical protein